MRTKVHLARLPALAMWCTIMLAGALPSPGHAVIAPKQAVPVDPEVQITIGLPHNYRAAGNTASHRERRCIDVPTQGTQVCARYSFGNHYQLLDWLENGRIDGAIVSPLVLKLLHSSDRQVFDQHFVAAQYDAFAQRELHKYHVAVAVRHNGITQSDPLSNYQAFLNSLLEEDQAASARLSIDSHLSPAMGVFLRSTSKWLESRALSDEELERFWRQLLARLSFSLSQPTAHADTTYVLHTVDNCDAGMLTCLTKHRLQDFLVLRRQAVPQFLYQGLQVSPDATTIANAYAAVAVDELSGTAADLAMPTALSTFIANNYTAHRVGAQVRRYFRFTIPEIMAVLHEDKTEGTPEDVALVLTGGGVKAAYQTGLVDHLYGEHYLINQSTRPPEVSAGKRQALPVKYVIGTSGGALLGLFVATIDRSGDPEFAELLWTDEHTGKFITFTDAFPFMDMLRWLSFLVSVIVFSVIAMILYRRESVQLHLGLMPKAQANSGVPVTDEAGRFVRFSLPWIVFLAVTPILLRYVNGEALAEHIPELQGVFYFLWALVAVYTDNHIIRTNTPHEKHRSLPPRVWAMLALGIALTLVALGRRWMAVSESPWTWLDESLSWKITVTTFIFCLGISLIVWFLQHWYLHGSKYFRRLTRAEGDVSFSFMVLVLVPVTSLLGIYVLYRLDLVSMLELTGSFWAGLVTIAAVVSLLIVSAGMTKWPRPITDWLVPRLRFLMSPHPTRWELHMNRHTRMIIMFGIAWGWWNLIVAPGMYGNDNPQEYMNRIFDHVVLQKDRTPNGPGNPSGQPVKLQTYFVAPATSLDTQSERYFLFSPDTSDGTDADNNIDYRHQIEIASDPRWTQFSPAEQSKQMLTQIAFASGSPFPVFPAHRIDIGGAREWLVDGGYAHNTPIEAAKALGAGRLLVIYSTPLDLSGPGARGFFDKVFGTMARNLPRLIPYLYERSQIEDILSAEELLVAALSPTGGNERWPMLTDFRQSVVERMFKEAKDDLPRRIGTFQNWGLPEFKN